MVRALPGGTGGHGLEADTTLKTLALATTKERTGMGSPLDGPVKPASQPGRSRLAQGFNTKGFFNVEVSSSWI